MIKKEEFLAIKECKENRLKRSQAAARVGVSHPTVTKYWGMTEEEFDLMLSQKEERRGTACRSVVYDDAIVEILKEEPRRTTFQVIDLIKEGQNLKDLELCDRTIQTRTAYLRKKFDLPKSEGPVREYEIVPDLGPGKQMQCDFGELALEKEGGGKVKVHFMVCLLCHSRYKHLTFQDHAFRSEEVVNALQDAFGYFGGMPEQMVIDQDCTMVVSENNGEVVYTRVFRDYIDKIGIKVYVCRPADPESKGKVENVVKYVKNNFLRYRKFGGIEALNAQALGWLDRTGNGKVHQTTKKVPAEVWSNTERDRLRPTPEYERLEPSSIITRVVRKDNTIVFKSNIYQLPTGTYRGNGQKVELEIKGSKMTILDAGTREHILTHTVIAGRGNLAKAPEDMLRHKKTFREEERLLVGFFDNDPTVGAFVSAVRADKPRYIGDQLSLMNARLGQWKGMEDKVILEMEWCLQAGEHSANALIRRLGLPEPGPEPKGQAYGESQSTLKRGLEDYAKIAAGGAERKGDGNEEPNNQ